MVIAALVVAVVLMLVMDLLVRLRLWHLEGWCWLISFLVVVHVVNDDGAG